VGDMFLKTVSRTQFSNLW